MSVLDELEEARGDLEGLLVDVLESVFGEEAAPAWEAEFGGTRIARARLAIHDEVTNVYTGVEVCVDTVTARLLAGRMLNVASPAADDLLDAVGELGNIAGGNVKSLLYQHARLSLPTPEILDAAGVTWEPAVRVHGVVLGQTVELAVLPEYAVGGLAWPPSQLDEVLETLP